MERMNIEADRESQQSRNTDVRLLTKRSRMQTFEDSKEDMDSYLSRFERTAEINQWPREDWAANLSALPTGQARNTNSRLSREDADDYDILKTALLNY